MKRSQLLSGILISFLVTYPVFLGTGCGDDEEPDFSLFNPELSAASVFAPFRFILDSRHYSPDDLAQEKGRERNISEWEDYLKGKVKRTDIGQFLYGTSPDSVMAARQDPALRKRIRMLDFAARRPELMEYLLFMKMSEHYLQADPGYDEYWYPTELQKRADKYRPLTDGRDSLIVAGLQMLPRFRDNFLRDRLAFLILRRCRYAEEFDQVISLFDRYFRNSGSRSIVRAWAHGHVAKAYGAQEDPAMANLMLVRAFYLSDDRKLRSQTGFQLFAYQETLALAADEKERSWIQAVNALGETGPGLDLIAQISDYSPVHPALEILVMREVQKADYYYLLPSLFDNYYYGDHWIEGEDGNEGMDDPLMYLSRFRNLVYSRLLPVEDRDHPLYSVVLAYLNLLIGDHRQAELLLMSLEGRNLAPEFKKQVAELRLMLITSRATSLSHEVLDQIADQIAKLRALPDGLTHNMYLYFSNQFTRMGKVHYAAGFQALYGNSAFDHLDQKGDTAAVRQMLEMSMNPQNKLEKLLIAAASTSKDHWLDLLGTKYFRLGLLDEAERTFAQISHDHWKSSDHINYHLVYDPEVANYNGLYDYSSGFYDHRDDVPPDLISDYRKKHILGIRLQKNTKLSYVRKMIQYREKLRSRPNDPQLLIKMGNLLYNTSYYGNSWAMRRYYRGYSEQYSEGTVFGNDADYFTTSAALAYYEKALKLTRNREQRAELLLMMARCRFNERYNRVSGQEDLPEDEAGNRYLEEFNKNYRNTAYFQKLRSICGTEHFTAFLKN